MEGKVRDIEASLTEQLRKITDTFKHITQTKRSRKENRRKAKKRKAPLSQVVIEKDNLKLGGLSNLSRSQVKYLRMIL